MILCGDMHPGFSTKYGTYSFTDAATGYVVAFCVVQLGMEAASSVGMERVRSESVLRFLLNLDVKVKVIAIDRSATVIKFLKDNFPFLEMQHDLWHIGKSIKKKLKALPKPSDQQEVSVWCQAIINHLYYFATTSDGNAELLLEKWHSVLYHITGVHSWCSDSDFKLHKSCDHDLLDEEEASLGERKLERAYCSGLHQPRACLANSPRL